MLAMVTLVTGYGPFLAAGVFARWNDLRAGDDRRVQAMSDLTRATTVYFAVVAAVILLVNAVVPRSPFVTF